MSHRLVVMGVRADAMVEFVWSWSWRSSATVAADVVWPKTVWNRPRVVLGD